MSSEQNNNESTSNNEIRRKNSRLSTITNESNDRETIRSKKCYICFEDIAATGKQFGLQNNCDHVFCYDCLTTWRRTTCMIDKDVGGRCPLCRIRSNFIAPSQRYFHNTADKQLLLEEHKENLKSIPCRYFTRNGHCRFGSRCYYKHNNPTRTIIDMPDDYEVYRSEGSTTFHFNFKRPIIRNINNDDFLETSLRNPPNSNRFRPY